MEASDRMGPRCSFPEIPIENCTNVRPSVRLVAVARSQSIEEEDRKKQEMKR